MHRWAVNLTFGTRCLWFVASPESFSLASATQGFVNELKMRKHFVRPLQIHVTDIDELARGIDGLEALEDQLIGT